jgi:abortive infection bacteriophage resistance protein
MTQPLKPWLSIQDQIDRLRHRGMHIADEQAAAQWLSAVGYYRLSGYWYPFREIDSTGGPGRRRSTFVSGTTFMEVVGLCEFDRHLKTLIQSGLERIEVALRSQVGHQLGGN